MPLILAIEPDRRQAGQLTALVRGRLHADLVLAESAERALAALGERVPDLILTSALLSPRDEAALGERLRALNGVAAHVQTLTIPVLASPHQSAGDRARGVLAALRRDKSSLTSQAGCDPAVFAEQCREYLDRVAAEREGLLELAADRQMSIDLAAPRQAATAPLAETVAAPPEPIAALEEPEDTLAAIATADAVDPRAVHDDAPAPVVAAAPAEAEASTQRPTSGVASEWTRLADDESLTAPDRTALSASDAEIEPPTAPEIAEPTEPQPRVHPAISRRGVTETPANLLATLAAMEASESEAAPPTTTAELAAMLGIEAPELEAALAAELPPAPPETAGGQAEGEDERVLDDPFASLAVEEPVAEEPVELSAEAAVEELATEELVDVATGEPAELSAPDPVADADAVEETDLDLSSLLDGAEVHRSASAAESEEPEPEIYELDVPAVGTEGRIDLDFDALTSPSTTPASSSFSEPSPMPSEAELREPLPMLSEADLRLPTADRTLAGGESNDRPSQKADWNDIIDSLRREAAEAKAVPPKPIPLKPLAEWSLASVLAQDLRSQPVQLPKPNPIPLSTSDRDQTQSTSAHGHPQTPSAVGQPQSAAQGQPKSSSVPSHPEASAAAPDSAEPADASQAAALKKRKKKAKGAPVQDEWGFFDPDRCGFAALLEKLDEITDE